VVKQHENAQPDNLIHHPDKPDGVQSGAVQLGTAVLSFFSTIVSMAGEKSARRF